MTAPAARWPDAPADARSLTDPGAAFDAMVEALCALAIADFARTTRLSDGTRSAQVVAWTRAFRDAGEAA